VGLPDFTVRWEDASENSEWWSQFPIAHQEEAGQGCSRDSMEQVQEQLLLQVSPYMIGIKNLNSALGVDPMLSLCKGPEYNPQNERNERERERERDSQSVSNPPMLPKYRCAFH
jgi:hypothetical protein